MNEETIKKLIQLTPEQRGLLNVVEQSLRALCESGVDLFYDYENEEVRAVNLNSFERTEAADYSDEEDYHNNGYETIPFWHGTLVLNYTCSMGMDDVLFGKIKPELLKRDRNLFNQ